MSWWTWVSSPFLFSILLWSACMQRDFMQGSKIYCGSPQALSYKVTGIRQLSEVTSNGRKALTDEVILTIIGLAGREEMNVTGENMQPFNLPAQNVGGLNVYGGLQIVPEHLNLIIKLVALGGGIETLTLSELAKSLVL